MEVTNHSLEYSFRVKVLHQGQHGPYTDSEYEYEITSERPLHEVKLFCTKILRPKGQEYTDWDRENADSFFKGYYTFEKLGNNKYRYYVKEPYCD